MKWGYSLMDTYEVCPTCGASLDIGEKCSICKPLITPIPIKVVYPKGYQEVDHNHQSKGE